MNLLFFPLFPRAFNRCLPFVILVLLGHGLARATPIAGTATTTGSMTQSASLIDFLPAGAGNGTFTVSAGGTGPFAALSGTSGVIKDLPSASVPVNTSISLVDFMTFAGNANVHFTLTRLNAGIFSSAACASPPAVGQTCTPTGSALNFVNVATNSSTISFGVQGVAINAATAETSSFTSTVSASFPAYYQTVLAILGGGGSVTTSYSMVSVVTAPPAITKAFGAANVPVNGTTSLTFTIQNPNSSTALSGVAFTDHLPAGLVVATPNGLSGVCGGGGVGAVGGSSTVSLSGAALAAASNCAFSVNVTGAAAGVKNNTTGTITSTNGGTGATSNTATLTVMAATLDIDASITATKYDALTDGLIAIRYLFGLTGTPLTNGALGATATRTDPAAIKSYLDGIRISLDIDGNGVSDALTDGLLIIRYMFGLRGPALTAGAFDPMGTRNTAPVIETYINSLMP